ncbi:Superfamily II DNA or RNA helicase, SNF2 family [Amycolatopsis xylanica]|uniref:Superfamily II DNA or RNA helicase, SNF2 family n=2 Tax=Amycolatopsis xylanica TaxID=589385 RepID=A0A1H2V9K2_9PSEU|nr:DEAD/DEAH box helicase [Amycolatopsis xylanica]SDW64985.1 Superfamily II DNA or RNA helicase, SNF2 family [Amycolatopsis xylanica]
MVFWSPEGGALPSGEAGSVTVMLPEGARTVPAVRLGVDAAAPMLHAARNQAGAHRSVVFWGALVDAAWRLAARGRLLPGVSADGFDAWRAGPLAADESGHLRALGEAMPPEARAVTPDGLLADAHGLTRDFVDAVVDGLPRTPAAVRLAGAPAFAAKAPHRVPELRGWADEVAAGLDAGVRLSLRIEGDFEGDFDGAEFRAVLQVHSLADPAQVSDAAELWADGAGPRARIDTLLAVRRVARVWPVLEQLLHAAVPDAVRLTDADLGELLGSVLPRLAAIGVEVRWPKDLELGLTARAVVDAGESAGESFFGADTLFGFDWQLALGDGALTEAEMDQLAEAHRPVVRLRGRWLLLDPALARKARDRALKPLTPIDALGAALTGTADIEGERVDVVSNGWLEALRARLTEAPEPAPQPAALAATLRDYQLRGLNWLDRMTSLGLGGCLADDMGLGKTITLIALHLHRASGPTLVVCPASLLGNWEREIRRFAPGTAVRRFHGGERSLDDVTDGFVLTTYGTMRLDAERLAGPRWGLLVADEAQHVKNARSGTAKALRRIPAQARVALTGTPVENNLSELWALLDWTTPGLLGSLGSFLTRWSDDLDGLSRLVRPFLLRRKKTDPGIAPELPPKTETDRPVGLTKEQAGLYEAVVRETLAQIAESDGMARRGLVMKLFTGLKQICNHPAQYLKDGGHAAGRSGKLELLDELLDTILAEDGAVLVFTQYVTMARIIESHLASRGITTQLLHGGTPVPKREELVRRFQAGEAPVFLLSLKAAGTGLNLTRADHVVHFDRWWNPAVEDQATDRAYRIGQTRPVQVHRLIAEGTVEDGIGAMLRGKRALADAVLASGEAALTELTDAELAELVELR